MKTAVFRVVAPYSAADVSRRFIGACRYHHQSYENDPKDAHLHVYLQLRTKQRTDKDTDENNIEFI
jgi:hypothetical protein